MDPTNNYYLTVVPFENEQSEVWPASCAHMKINGNVCLVLAGFNGSCAHVKILDTSKPDQGWKISRHSYVKPTIRYVQIF